MRREWSAVFPDHRVMGCTFHFSQTIQRRVQEGGMARLYHDNKSVLGKAFTGVVWMVLAFPMIPLNR